MKLLILALIAALTLVPASVAKKPAHAATTATLSAAWTDGKLSISGCGYDATLPQGGVQVVYTHPDGSTETWWVGIYNVDNVGCLDNNYIPATDPGVWTVDTYQAGIQVAEATVTVG